MREVIFRGIKTTNNEFAFGYYSRQGVAAYIFTPIYDRPNKIDLVIPETIGQYTGLKDKKGVKIFEGDVCRFNTKNGQKNHEQKVIVFWGIDAQFRIKNSNGSAFYMSDSLHLWISYDFEVIGNIHQNPELLTT